MASAWPPELLQIVGAPVAVALWQPIPGVKMVESSMIQGCNGCNGCNSCYSKNTPDLRHLPISRLLSNWGDLQQEFMIPKSNRDDDFGWTMIEWSRNYPSTPSQRLCKEGMLHSSNIVHFEDNLWGQPMRSLKKTISCLRAILGTTPLRHEFNLYGQTGAGYEFCWVQRWWSPSFFKPVPVKTASFLARTEPTSYK